MLTKGGVASAFGSIRCDADTAKRRTTNTWTDGRHWDLDPHNFGFVNYGVIAQIYDRLARYYVEAC